MSFGEAITTYSLLTVGDGLVSQIPALLLSVATGLIVTRADRPTATWARDLLAPARRSQTPRAADRRLRRARRSCLIPGLPKLPFLLVGGAVLLHRPARCRERGRTRPRRRRGRARAARRRTRPRRSLGEMRVDPLELELAADLVDLVDAGAGGDLLDRVRALRRKIAARPRHRHAAGAHPRQPRPAAAHLRDPAARRRGRPAARRRPAPCSPSATTSARCPARRPASRCSAWPAKWVPAELRQPGRAAPAPPSSTGPR